MDSHVLARMFANGLRLALTDQEWQSMRERNATAPENVCASHDFCDANMIMDEAFSLAMGREFLPDESEPTDADVALWNDAWRKAKRTYLSAKARAHA